MKKDIKTKQRKYLVKFWEVGEGSKNNPPAMAAYTDTDNIEGISKKCIDHILSGILTKKFPLIKSQAPCIYQKSSDVVIITDTYFFDITDQAIYGIKYWTYTYQIVKL